MEVLYLVVDHRVGFNLQVNLASAPCPFQPTLPPGVCGPELLPWHPHLSFQPQAVDAPCPNPDTPPVQVEKLTQQY